MPIPDFQSIMLPLLELTADGAERSIGTTVETLSSVFQLTSGERSEMLPSGAMPKFSNRVQWALSYLRNAAVLESTGRGRFRITTRGRLLLGQKVERIDIKFLMQYPEFKAFRTRTGKPAGPSAVAAAAEQTPEEAFESSYVSLRSVVEQDLLQRVKSISPTRFEQLVVQLLVAMGYGGSVEDAGQAVGQTGDGGIDGIIKEDRLGLDAIYVQAKRWEAIDGLHLTRLMFDCSIGVTQAAPPFVLKRVDLDFFDEG